MPRRSSSWCCIDRQQIPTTPNENGHRFGGRFLLCLVVAVADQPAAIARFVSNLR